MVVLVLIITCVPDVVVAYVKRKLIVMFLLLSGVRITTLVIGFLVRKHLLCNKCSSLSCHDILLLKFYSFQSLNLAQR